MTCNRLLLFFIVLPALIFTYFLLKINGDKKGKESGLIYAAFVISVVRGVYLFMV